VGITKTIAVPVTDPLVAFIIVVPATSAVKSPVLEFTVPTVSLLLDQVTVADIESPYWSFGEAANVWVSPTTRFIEFGMTFIEFRNGGMHTPSTGSPFRTVPIIVPPQELVMVPLPWLYPPL